MSDPSLERRKRVLEAIEERIKAEKEAEAKKIEETEETPQIEEISVFETLSTEEREQLKQYFDNLAKVNALDSSLLDILNRIGELLQNDKTFTVSFEKKANKWDVKIVVS